MALTVSEWFKDKCMSCHECVSTLSWEDTSQLNSEMMVFLFISLLKKKKESLNPLGKMAFLTLVSLLLK